MTLIQLIDHLKKVLHDNGDVDMEVKVERPTSNVWTEPYDTEPHDIVVDPESKTITFT